MILIFLLIYNFSLIVIILALYHLRCSPKYLSFFSIFLILMTLFHQNLGLRITHCQWDLHPDNIFIVFLIEAICEVPGYSSNSFNDFSSWITILIFNSSSSIIFEILKMNNEDSFKILLSLFIKFLNCNNLHCSSVNQQITNVKMSLSEMSYFLYFNSGIIFLTTYTCLSTTLILINFTHGESY